MPDNYQKAKDVFIQRRTSDNKHFEEFPLIVEANSVLSINSTNDLVMTPLSSFAQGTSSLSSSYSITSSYALNVAGTGSNGTSGTSGNAGTSGTAGTSGNSGSNGTSGINGTSGTTGTSGNSGSNGTSGTSGLSGTSGTSSAGSGSGTSGTSGNSGTAGTSGINGTSGTSGAGGSGTGSFVTGSTYQITSSWALLSQISDNATSASYAATSDVFNANQIYATQVIGGIVYANTLASFGDFFSLSVPIIPTITDNMSLGTTQSKFLNIHALNLVGTASMAQFSITRSRVVNATFANPFVTNARLGDYFRSGVSSSFLLQNPTNPMDGQTITWEFIQTGSGNISMSYGSKFAFCSSLTGSAIQLNGTASKRDILSATYNQITDKWYLISFAKEF